MNLSVRPLPPLAALIFDMDGLLVDSEPHWFDVERAFAAERGGAWTEAHAHACVGRGLPATLAWMRDALGFVIDVERDSAAIIDAFIASVDRLELKPGSRALLDAATGALPFAVASSSPLRLIEATLRRFDLLHRFDAVVSGDMVARAKPAPDIFLLAADRLAAPPARCAVLEDSLAGATAGRAAGMFVIAVPEGPAAGRGYEAVADAIVPSLVEARALLALG